MSAQPEELWRLHPMHTAHVSRVLELERASYEFPWTEGIFRDCLRVGYSAWVVTDSDGDVLAYALMSVAAGEAHILNICVSPQQRRRGLAQFLLKHLVMLARAASVTLMLLEVRESNLAGRALYERFGFRSLGQRRGYYPARDGREDALVLGLSL